MLVLQEVLDDFEEDVLAVVDDALDVVDVFTGVLVLQEVLVDLAVDFTDFEEEVISAKHFPKPCWHPLPQSSSSLPQ